TTLGYRHPILSPISARHRPKSGRIAPINHANTRKVLIPPSHRSMRCRCSTRMTTQVLLCFGHNSSSQTRGRLSAATGRGKKRFRRLRQIRRRG
ncbi:hypothetical protein CCMA1212_007773, partial [Trichoderma ghanense]